MRHSNYGRALAGAALIAARSLSAQAPGAPIPQVVTSGLGQAHVTPDRATIFIGVQSRAATASAASVDNARRARAVLDTLRALGLSADQVSTMNYNVSPEMQWPQPPSQTPPRVVGYTVTNTVRADVRRIEDVGKAIDASIAKGANEVSSLEFYSSKADSARRSALADAVSNARADAEAIAKAAGGSLGQLLEVSNSSPTPRTPDFVAGRVAMAAVQTPVEPGQQTISVSITVRWAFVAGR